MAEVQTKDLTPALRAWVKKNKISINDFAAEMGYSYAYAWTVLRGKGKFTAESFGRFVFAYGLQSGQEIMALAGYPSHLGKPADAKAVPIVYVHMERE